MHGVYVHKYSSRFYNCNRWRLIHFGKIGGDTGQCAGGGGVSIVLADSNKSDFLAINPILYDLGQTT